MSAHPSTRFFGGFILETRFEVFVAIDHAIDPLFLIGGIAFAEDVND